MKFKVGNLVVRKCISLIPFAKIGDIALIVKINTEEEILHVFCNGKIFIWHFLFSDTLNETQPK